MLMRLFGLLLAMAILLGAYGGFHLATRPVLVHVAGPAPQATLRQVLGPTGHPAFGISVADRSDATIDALATRAGCAPRWVQLFASVANSLSLASLKRAPGIPMLTVEPWHPGKGVRQADFTLAATINGKWDGRYERMAAVVKAYRQPVLIRYAHEMNGDWYPWGAISGNTAWEYQAAWRHVVQLFRRVGARNAVWVWSPNIERGTAGRNIRRWYPGDKWVDLVGLTGYGVNENSPAVTYAKTLPQAMELTDKPIILTETGAQPGPLKTAWIRAFGPWLAANRRIAGFVWSERYESDSSADWRFDDTSANLRAFRSTLASGGVNC